jgi:ferredoxin
MKEKRLSNMATIFCFTSTGNGLYIANSLATIIGGKVLPMNSSKTQFEDDIIGFVFPNYFWGLPRIVERFVTQTQIANKDAYVFAVETCGGPGSGELGRLKELLKAKGICLRYGARLISGSNYIPFYKEHKGDTFRQQNDDSIINIARAINNRESNRIPAYTIINKIIYSACPNESSDQYFTVSATCDNCMICQRVCPVNNIKIGDGRPEFQHRCEHCLACLHHCPKQAINWKEKTEGKERYRNSAISLNELIAFTHSGESTLV